MQEIPILIFFERPLYEINEYAIKIELSFYSYNHPNEKFIMCRCGSLFSCHFETMTKYTISRWGIKFHYNYLKLRIVPFDWSLNRKVWTEMGQSNTGRFIRCLLSKFVPDMMSLFLTNNFHYRWRLDVLSHAKNMQPSLTREFINNGRNIPCKGRLRAYK